MKVLQIIKKIIIGILAIAFFGFVIFMTILLLNYNKYGVTQFDKTSLILIREGITSDKYKKGDLVLVDGVMIENITVGDEVFAYKVSKEGTVSIDLGIVGELHPNESAITLKNGATYAMDFVIGKTSKVYNKVGTYLSIIESKWGFLFIILVPSLLIFIYELYALIIEIKYGKDEVLVNQQ
jgi:hypothetical protein